MKFLKHLVLFFILAGVIAGCSSSNLERVGKGKIPPDWRLEVKKKIADPFHYKFILEINGKEVLERISNSDETSEVEISGLQITMEDSFRSGLLNQVWKVEIFVDGRIEYQKEFREWTGY